MLLKRIPHHSGAGIWRAAAISSAPGIVPSPGLTARKTSSAGLTELSSSLQKLISSQRWPHTQYPRELRYEAVPISIRTLLDKLNRLSALTLN